MFSGIVEASSPVLEYQQTDKKLFRLKVQKPVFFDDLKTGDSIAVNGVCLTVVDFNSKSVSFDLAQETLSVTGWSEKPLQVGQLLNLERSLRLGDRIHGHLLSGHVDRVAEVVGAEPLDESTWSLQVQLGDTKAAAPYVWKKGSIGLSGVSLTVNSYIEGVVEVCLIPETLKLTNLKQFKKGDRINIEFDWMAKALFNQTQNMKKEE